MSQSIETLYQNALLADAAYLDWARNPGESDIEFEARLAAELVNKREFTEEQARLFVERYEVIVPLPNTDSGFAATLFRDKEDPNQKEVLAIRGSEIFGFGGVDDIHADFHLAVSDGEARDQYFDLQSFVADLLNQGHLQNPIDVTGHSLGGHLVTLLATDPTLGDLIVDHAYTYNGAGLGQNNGAAFDQAFEILAGQLGIDIGNIPSGKITNIFSTAGFELTAGLGTIYGEVLPIFTESQTFLGSEYFGAPFNHLMENLTNSLAVYRVFEKLDSTISLDVINDILSSTSKQPQETLQTFIEKLGDLFTTFSGNRSIEKIDEFLIDLQNSLDNILIPEGSLIVNNLLNDSAASIETSAKEATNVGKAYRHALRELNSFVVFSPEDAGTFEIYKFHNTEQELELENFSDSYLHDRALFLELKLDLANEDLEHEETPSIFELFEDKASGFVIDNRPDGIFEQKLSRRFIFGSDGDDQGEDRLEGGDSIDHLYGGSGNDDLYANTVDDWEDELRDELRGGSGIDKYFVGKGDEIEDDAEGEGIIKYQKADGSEIEVSNRTYKLTQENVYESQEANEDDRLKVQLNTTTNTLTVLGETSFTILNFESGHFNIILDGEPAEVEYDTLLVGTVGDDGSSDFPSTAFNDEIRGYGGNDTANGGDGQAF